ncbi:MAG TPA: diguanylate cyclase [Rugosimonospora sp.]|nr:diguanylate cyclase [Rugosimonospora sp.]
MVNELLYENSRTRVWRLGQADRGSSIRKEPRGPEAARRVRHERSILSRLDGVRGVPRLLPSVDEATAILLEDCRGVPLSERLASGPVDPAQLLAWAVVLVEIIGAVHHRGVVHKDVNPANILLYGAPDCPMLIDYDLATTFAVERPGFTHHNEIAGTLAYLAPEQTGRTGWSVDQRTDLYGLGATLYEMATGTPPFGDGDPLQLTHDHLIRVPVPVCEVNPAVPAALSAIIAHLLEKEPDRRYQSAEGVLYDLRRLAEPRQAPVGFTPGRHDFPRRLSAPSHLIGRGHEVGVLRDALDAAICGQVRALLVCGPPGVGKTALIDELRPIVTAAGGWFVAGKFDQYRHDASTNAVRQAMRGLGRLLLAEPEAELAAVRSRLNEALGTNAGLAAAVLPEFEGLLGVDPEPAGRDDPLRAQVRLHQAAAQILRTLVSPQRPLVIFLDDLQWAGTGPIRFLDTVLGGESLHGVLLVGAYRDAEVDPSHPLSVLLARWRQLDPPPPHLYLSNLPPDDLGVLLAEMLRVPAAEGADLASAIGPRTDGNPFDTVEFVNALRRDGVLSPAVSTDGWAWQPNDVRQHVGVGDVVALLAGRVAALPEPARELLQTMACLGADLELDLLTAATAGVAGGPAGPGQVDGTVADLDDVLAPALEDGLLVMEAAGGLRVRFRHDRIQQAVYGSLGRAERQVRHLAIARRLAAVPGYRVIAAEQYLPVAGDLAETAERRRVAVLFRDAARHARMLASYPVVERFLAAAGQLLEPSHTAADARLRVEVCVERHAALLGLGAFDEADSVYKEIEAAGQWLLLADAASLQIAGLLMRGRPADAVELGLSVLERLEHPAPAPADLMPAIHRGIAALQAWVATGSAEVDVQRGVNTDPRDNAVARVINRTIPAAFFAGSPVMAWLMTSAAQMWAGKGVSAALIGPMAHASFVTIVVSRDYRTGHAAVSRVLAVGEALGYELETAQARTLHALSASPWFDPIEESIRHARRAREALIRGGDLMHAAFTYYVTVGEAIENAPTLDDAMAEMDSALAFVARTGADHVGAYVLAWRQAVRTLRGETHTPGGADDASFDERTHLERLAANPTAAGTYHLMRALVSAVFANPEGLARHAPVAYAMMPAYEATHATGLAHLVQALSLLWQAREAAAPQRTEMLAAADHCRGWVADRTIEAPHNFLPWRCLLDAERAWTTGDFQAATLAFDAAQREVDSRQSPWLQRALITERRARFGLAHGLEHAGRAALREAADHYRQWGATAKVDCLTREFPFLQATAEPVTETHDTASTRRSSSVSPQMIDILAVLRASQALSSETNLARLQERVTEVLCTLTGATGAHLLLRDTDTDTWFLLPVRGGGPDRLPVEQAATLGLLPLSAVRYVQRTGESLLAEDATRDDRFARDPYLRGVPECALLVVPILSRGEPSAMLLLENRRARAAFGSNRLDTVQLIAGQLSVSLDNALLYAALEDKVAERTQALRDANDRLELLAVTDALTGLPNRRRLIETLAAEWTHALRSHTPIALAMIDVDHFKLYNDHYGHLAGDECLARVAAAIASNLRETDVVARYGGEEFAVVLPGTDRRIGAKVAERVRAAVAALAVPHQTSHHGIVTVSVGLAATVPAPHATAEQLLETADNGLYEAKHRGRNQVSLSPPDG